MTRPAFADILNLGAPLPVIPGETSRFSETAEDARLDDEGPTEVEKFIARRRRRRTRS